MSSKNLSDVMKDKGNYLPYEQIDRALKKCKTLKEKVLLLLLSRTGRRLSEVLNLRVKDIDFENELIAFTILKKNPRKDKRKKKADPPKKMKPVDKHTLEVLKEWIELKGLEDNDYIMMFDAWLGEPARKLSRFGAYKMIRKIFERVGIEQVGDAKPHPHTLRHSFAIHFIRNSENKAEDIIHLKNILEHSHIDMTMHYLDFTDDERTKAHLRRMFDIDTKEETLKGQNQ